jgi:outer membrane receptor protein involved in Fe transport
LYGGNLQLKPEIADTKTFGFVYTPEAVPGLAVSADYFDIFVDKYIDGVDALTVINQCLQSGSDYFCNLFHRDPASGILFGSNGYIIATSQNTGYLQTSGVDITSSYRFDLSKLPFIGGESRDWGSVDISLVGTWLNSRRIEQLPGLGSYNCQGLFGPTCGQPTPAWRHNMRFTWSPSSGAGTVSANWRYFGPTSLSSNTDNQFLHSDDPVTINSSIAHYSYLDLGATWKVFNAVELRAGVNNAFDKSPPAIAFGLLSDFGNGNTYPGVYDPMGRLLFAGMTVQF